MKVRKIQKINMKFGQIEKKSIGLSYKFENFSKSKSLSHESRKMYPILHAYDSNSVKNYAIIPLNPSVPSL